MSAAVIASIVLGAVFLLAGAAKIAAGHSWPQQARELGAPAVVAPLVPWIEIVIGAVLVSQSARAFAAVAAILMLIAFTALIVWRLAEGEHPACACFGAWSARPIGAIDVIRNVLLIGIGVVAIIA